MEEEKVSEKKVLFICRFDGIGDYVIMRRFFKSIRNSKKYKDYKIIFAGRNEFSSFAEKYDSKYIDEFIWVHYPSFMAEQEVRKKYLQMFERMHADEVISPVYDREVYVCEKVVDQFKEAKEVYGHKGPLDRLKKVLSDNGIEKYNKNYTQFIDTGDGIMPEEKRYKLFFEQILGEECLPDEGDFNIPIDLNSDYVLIGPFSGAPIRTWSMQNYVSVINYITSTLNYKIGILGGDIDRENADKIIEAAKDKDKIINLSGIVPISELPIYLSKAKFLLTNETGTVHIAKSVGVKTYCISNGSYAGRFQPYENSGITYIYPDNIDSYLSEHNEYGIECSCDINSITPEKVIKTINGEKPKLNDRLNIILVTYNRKYYLEQTLKQLFNENSPVKDFDITILDNASTDGSSELIQEYSKQFKNIKHIRHKQNIGGNPNIARAFEYTNKEYLWIICDDDYYNWDNWNEVENGIAENHDVIIVDNEDMSDRSDIADIIFQLSFLPSGIYKTSCFTDELFRNIYDNISNWYPHLTVGINIANTTKDFYIVKNSCVVNGAAANVKNNLPSAPASLARGLDASKIFPEQQAYSWGVAYINTLTLLSNEYDIMHFINQALKHPPSGVGHDYYTFSKFIINSIKKNPKAKNLFFDVYCRVNWKLRLIMLYIKYFENVPILSWISPTKGIPRIIWDIVRVIKIKLMI